MIEGAMRHGTTMEVDGNYTDSHSPRSGSASLVCSGSTCCRGLGPAPREELLERHPRNLAAAEDSSERIHRFLCAGGRRGPIVVGVTAPGLVTRDARPGAVLRCPQPDPIHVPITTRVR